LIVKGDDRDGVEGRQAKTRVSKWLTIAAAAIAALVVGAVSLASSSAPPPEARALGGVFFNRNMARSEVVMVVRGVVHDYRLDQGKVVASRGGTIELQERDGTRQSIPIAPDAQILVNGKISALVSVPLRVNAITIRDGDQPASVVRITGSPKKP
jgi:hypothetical protein